ncbi:MAG: hypothetical protein JSR56_11565 [Proteobacteria bacterium]|nr:hypothetical protein [Pseudomonadota bacterium]
MKLHMIAMALAGFAGAAAAGQSDAVLQTVIVSGSTITECPHPYSAKNHACDALNRLVRANFTRREIDILFGTLASDTWYRRASFGQLQKRYLAVVHQYAAQQDPARQSITVK